jgi:DNA-3-methyladenine glycosylase II
MTPPFYWQDAKNHLAQRDPKLAQLILAYPYEALLNLHNPFYTLTRAIVGQQISVKAADSIWHRLENLLESFRPECYLEIKVEELKLIGLSRQKINYISNIAHSFLEEKLTQDLWQDMEDDAVAEQLMKIKGIGIWTAQMFLIFHLHRPNILPLSDLGLLNSIKQIYGIENKTEILKLAKNWNPYCTVATWYLWRSIDPQTIQY